jgi:hypothetical protein
MPSARKWFGVKIVLRTVATGRVRGRDADYDRDGTLVEERVVIVRAHDGKDAFARARQKAAKELSSYRNVYGQTVRQRILAGHQVYELYAPPSDGAEVFSTTTRVPKTLTGSDIVSRLDGGPLSDANQKKRRRFIAADLIPGLDAIWARRRLTRG